MLTTRVLDEHTPPAEWYAAVAGTPFAHLAMGLAVIVLVEVDGQVVARWAAINTVHLEGLQIEPDYQGHPGVGRALLSTMLEALNARKVPEVLTNAETPDVEDMLTKIGATRIPGTQWVLALGGGT